MTVTASPCPIIPLDQNSHQTVTRFLCVGFSMYVCGVSVPQMRQFCLFTYPQRSKWASSEKRFFLAKSASSVNRSHAHLAKRIHNRTKHWLVLRASRFQCTHAGFLCPKCDNFACLNTRQDQNVLHLKNCCFCQNLHLL